MLNLIALILIVVVAIVIQGVQFWEKQRQIWRVNKIFSTINEIRQWNFNQVDQRERQAIRHRLNAEAETFLVEHDPQLRRLRREMEDINRLLDEFDRRAPIMGASRTSTFPIAANNYPGHGHGQSPGQQEDVVPLLSVISN